MAQNRDKEETTEQLKLPENLPLCIPPPSIPVPASRSPDGSDPKGTCGHARANSAGPVRSEERRGPAKRSREAMRCAGSGCRKRIGIVGFRCRCGDVFCSEHRYSDRHDCGYDYKAAGRAAIARENPVVRAAKLVKV